MWRASRKHGEAFYRTGIRHGYKAKGAREKKKTHNDEQGEADRLMAFSMFYRIKGMEATGQVHDIWPRARLFIIRHVVFRYWAWIFWRPGLGI